LCFIDLRRVHNGCIARLKRHNVAPIVAASGSFLLSRVPDVMAADLFGSVMAFERTIFGFASAVLAIVLFYVTTTWLDYAARCRLFAHIGEPAQRGSRRSDRYSRTRRGRAAAAGLNHISRVRKVAADRFFPTKDHCTSNDVNGSPRASPTAGISNVQDLQSG
jgi:hypothetical protein